MLKTCNMYQEKDYIVIGNGIHTLLLHNRLLQQNINVITFYIRDKQTYYLETCDLKNYDFDPNVNVFFEQEQLKKVIKEEIEDTYLEYDSRYQTFLLDQFRKNLPQFKVSVLPKVKTFGEINTSSKQLFFIESIKELVLKKVNTEYLVSHGDTNYSSEYLLLNHYNLQENLQHLIQKKIPRVIEYRRKINYRNESYLYNELIINQKIQKPFVITLTNNEKNKKIIIEVTDRVLVCCIGYNNNNIAKYYLSEISILFKIGGDRKNIITDVSKIDLTRYHYTNRIITNTFINPISLNTSDLEKIYSDKNTFVLNIENFKQRFVEDMTYNFCILSSYQTLQCMKYLNRSSFYVRGTFNNWGCLGMIQINSIYYETTLDLTQTKSNDTLEIKIDNGMWIDSYPRIGNYEVLPGKVYKMYFNDVTKDIYHVDINSMEQSWYVRGGFNNWEKLPMEKYNFEFTCEVLMDSISGNNCFKIDNGTWSESYPEDDIYLPQGRYLIKFNLLNRSVNYYKINPSQIIDRYLITQPMFGYNVCDLRLLDLLINDQ